MTSPRHPRVANSLLTTIALGLAITFIFVISALLGTADARPVKPSTKQINRVVRDVTPSLASAETQQFSARQRLVKKYRTARRGGARYAAPSTQSCIMNNDGRTICGQPYTPTSRVRTAATQDSGAHLVVGGRQAGDPLRYCGAEAVRYVYGVAASARRDLWLAANWVRKFNRTSPAPGMAAARPGHVMVLISQASGSDWLVHDGNSGGGLTRRHVRSIAGYTVVDPHSPRMAARVTHDYSAHGRTASAVQ